MENVFRKEWSALRTRLVHNLQYKPTSFCCICCKNYKEIELFNVYDDFRDDSFNKLNLIDVLGSLFGNQVKSVLASDTICSYCKEQSLNAHHFIENAKKSAEILTSIIDEINNEIKTIQNRFESTNNYENVVIYMNNSLNIAINEQYHSENESLSDNDANCTKPSPVNKKADEKFIANIIKSRVIKGKHHLCPECKQFHCKHAKYMIQSKTLNKLGKRVYKCASCQFLCSSKLLLLGHINKQHLKDSPYLCEICSKPLHSKLSYKNHMISYHTVAYCCEYCDVQFRNQDLLEHHKERCKEIKHLNKCTKCPASFRSKNKLLFHAHKHDPQYPCNLCLKVFANKNMLLLHQDVHTKEKLMRKDREYICFICNDVFKTSIERSLHLKSTHKSNEKPYCKICDLQLDSHNRFKRHLKSIQHLRRINPNVEKRYKCNDCNYTTDLYANLESHINRFHLTVAPYSCITCEKKFTGTRTLNQHMKTHLLTKSHQCDACGKYLCGPSALKKHIRRFHTEGRPHQCHLCGHWYETLALRNAHKMKEHRDRNVKCPLCDAKFHALKIMRNHVKGVHWKLKGEKFDITKVEGLKDEHYELFRDRRLLFI